MKEYIFAISLLLCLGLVLSDSPISTTPSIETECNMLNASCDTCVSNPACLWCNSAQQKCMKYPVGEVIPKPDHCDLSHARWGVCWLNYKALLIAMGTIAAVIVLSISCCCVYCCCCRSKTKQRRKIDKDEAKYEREREERSVQHAARKEERQGKYDDIRRKYGLIKEDNPYQKFDNDI